MESSTVFDLLRSLLLAVRQDIKPNLQSPQAKHRAELLDMLLVRLAAELEQGSAATDFSSGVSVAPEDVKALQDLSINLSEEKKEQIAQTIAAFSSAEHNWRTATENRLIEIGKQKTIEERVDDSLDIPKEVFTDYLRRKFPQNSDIEVMRVTVIPGGRSKGTILLDTRSPAGEDFIIIRRDFQANTTGVSVTYEYPIIVALWKAGLQVPEPRWMEEDTSVIGGAFIAFSRVAGQAMGSLFHSDAPADFVKQFAAALARIHAVDIDQAGIGDKLNWGQAEHPVRAMVDTFYQDYIESVPPTALMDTAFAWLYLQMDKIGNERSLVHGDAGLHNTMGDGGKLTGILDWEFAHAGDPAEDLLYYKGIIEKIVDWQEFLDTYRDNGGHEISTARIEFFTVWRSVLLGVMMGRAASIFLSGRDQDMRVATIGLNSFPKY